MAFSRAQSWFAKALPSQSAEQSSSRLLAICCLALLCVIVFQVTLKGGRKQTLVEPAQPDEIVIEGLAVPTSALDIGEVWEAKNFL